MSLPTEKIQEAVLNQVTNVVIGDIAKGEVEKDKLLAVYNESIKGDVEKIINQHKISGAFAGPLPTHGLLTSINMIVLYRRLSKVLDIEAMKKLDALVANALSSSKWAFVKLGTSLFLIKQAVSLLDETAVAAPIGIALGLFCGYKFTHRAGLQFANNVSKMVDEALLSEETKQLPPKKGFFRRMIPFM